jgi:hypothetical protein
MLEALILIHDSGTDLNDLGNYDGCIASGENTYQFGMVTGVMSVGMCIPKACDNKEDLAVFSGLLVKIAQSFGIANPGVLLIDS